jgi:hypothetical protein
VLSERFAASTIRLARFDAADTTGRLGKESPNGKTSGWLGTPIAVVQLRFGQSNGTVAFLVTL